MSVSNSTTYQSPFTVRYASEDMKTLFSLQHKHASWRKVWYALAAAEKEMGLPITQMQLDELQLAIETIDFAKVSEFEEKLKHDVMAHLHAYGIDCPTAKPILHMGATSCNITDNADVMLYKEALCLIQQKLNQLVLLLAEKADSYKAMPCLAYTHFQAAQPTTLGKRFALWLEPLWVAAKKIDNFIHEMRPLGMKGATGTQNSFMELFVGDYVKVKQLDLLVARKLGFDKVWPISGQTYPRSQDVDMLECLSSIAVGAKKMSTDIRLLAHDKEIDEPFGKEQVGSSAMPYKRNPMTFENICSLARLVMEASSVPKQVASEQWLERTLDDSASRRFIPETFLATDAILNSLIATIKDLVIYPKMIQRNLDRELPFMATENILMACVRKGSDRQVLHERLRVLSQQVGDEMKNNGAENTLLERIAKEQETFSLSKEELFEIVKPEKFVGAAKEQVEDFLQQELKL
jgi:adenylosuccinate lyase